MSFIQLRIHTAFPLGKNDNDVTNEELRLYSRVIKDIVTESAGDYTVGFEKTNKYGEETKHHFHVCYETSGLVKKNTLQKNIKDLFATYEIYLRSNEAYSVQVLNEPNDYDRWIRYPLKENPVKDLCKVPNIDNLIMLAKDEKERTKVIHLRAREKTLEKNTLYDRLKEWLVERKVKGTRKQVYCKIDEWYTEQKKGLKFQTLLAYTDLYMREEGLITASQYFDENIR